MTSVIEDVYALAIAPSKDKGAKEERDALQQAHSILLPMEEKSKNRIAQRITELDTILRQSRHEAERIPLDPLGWRWKNGLPKVVPLSLKSPHFSISASKGRGSALWSVAPDMPRVMAEMFEDVGERAKRYCIRQESRYTMTYTFDGVIPSSARIALKKAVESGEYDQFFMLVETPEKEWEISQVKGITRRQAARELAAAIARDPIIVGYADEALWVIDKFDLTTLEQYILDEFSQPALLPGK